MMAPAMSERAGVATLPPSASWSVDQALDYARSEGLDEVIIVGTKDGRLKTRSSAIARNQVVFLLEQAKLTALA